MQEQTRRRSRCSSRGWGADNWKRLGFPGSFRQTGAGDVTPPRLLAFDFTPRRINTASGDVQITFMVRAADDLSGVQSVIPYVFPPQGDGWGVGLELVSGTARDGIWTGSITIPRYSQYGDWTVSISVWDYATSMLYKWNYELEAAGYPSSFINGP